MRLLRWLVLSLLLASLLSCAGVSTPHDNNSPPPGNNNGTGPNSSFFGMQMSTGVLNKQPWPTAPFASIRLWDTNTTWDTMNPAPGVYDWTVLDRWLAAAQAHGVSDILYTFGKTPVWASASPNDTSCAAFWGPGGCDPPDDLNPDGTGTNQHWKDFVTALATHAAGKIKFWETWNEPENPTEWTGTPAQLVRMAKDARTIILNIDPNAEMLTPPSQDLWFKNYVASGGLQYADIVTIHGYFGIHCGVFPDASRVADRVSNIRATMAAAGVPNKPLWDTEASWGDEQSNCFNDQDQRAAFLAQFYLLHLSANVSRFYWYQWNNNSWGTLWTPDPIPNGTVLAPGLAYQQIHDWLQDSTMAAPCTSSGTQWTCTFTGDNGYQAEAIWDTSQSCSNGVCSTIKILVDPQYTRMKDLTGSSSAVPDRTVAIGIKPVWLSNQ